jgi:transcriptional regulator with XRE-family HTH domain
MPVLTLEAGFGERLRVLRLRQALSQRDLARKARIEESTVVYLEAESRQPRPSTVRKLARALGVPPSELTTPE